MNIGQHIISGVLTRAGTFPIRDLKETGFVVTCSVDYLRSLPTLPMYQPVVIIPVTELERMQNERRQVEMKLNDALVENAELKKRWENYQ